MAANYEDVKDADAPKEMSVSLKIAADRLGKLKAKISRLKEQEERMREILVGSGRTEIDGDLFRVTVSHAEREQVDVAALKDAVSRQFLTAHTSIIPTTTVRVTARKS